MQRCASHIASKTDIDESVKIGEEAVKAAVEGMTGKMMAFKRISDRPYFSEIVPVDANEVANKEKLFPKEWINNQGNNVTSQALDYFLPLIQGELNILMKNGMPVHFKICLLYTSKEIINIMIRLFPEIPRKISICSPLRARTTFPTL